MHCSDIPSAKCAVPHKEGLPVPDAPESFSLESDDEKEKDETSGPEPSISQDSHFFPFSFSAPHIITQSELIDLVRDLEVPKSKAGLLGSRLRQWNLQAGDVRVSMLCDHQQDLVPFFFQEGDLVTCNFGVMAAVNMVDSPDECRLFIDSLKKSLFKPLCYIMVMFCHQFQFVMQSIGRKRMSR